MNRALILSLVFGIVSCGQEDKLTLISDEDICDSLTCTATMGVRVHDERGHSILGVEVFAVDAQGHLFDTCVTTAGGKNHHDESGYHWYNGCDLQSLPLDTRISLNLIVNGITSFAEIDWELNSVVDPPHFAAFSRLEEGQY